MLKYTIDTSAILDAWTRYYPIDLFPTFWANITNLVQSKRASAIVLVRYELDKKDDGCVKWFDTNGLDSFFDEISTEIQNEVISILSNKHHQRLIEERKGQYGADPFIIAHAKLKNLTLVTGERPANNIQRPKIPDVCNDLNIRWINIQSLMREEKWQF